MYFLLGFHRFCQCNVQHNLSKLTLGGTGTGSQIGNHVGSSTSHQHQCACTMCLLEFLCGIRCVSFLQTNSFSKKGFFNLFANFSESVNFKKSDIIWENEHNFSIIWLEKEQCYQHNMLLLPSTICQSLFPHSSSILQFRVLEEAPASRRNTPLVTTHRIGWEDNKQTTEKLNGPQL